MKRLSVAFSFALVGLLMLAPLVQAARSSTPFTGEWIGQDPCNPGDCSTVHLYVSAGDRPGIVFTDEYGTVCVINDAPSVFFTALLSGLVDGDTLWGRFNVAKCGSLTLRFLTGEIASWVLDENGNSDPSDDTLFDGSVLWSRN